MARILLTLASLLLPGPVGFFILAGAYEASSEQELIFSHRKHLERAGTGCADCHAPALRSTAADENLLPGEKTCLRCHDGVRARKECTLCHENPARVRQYPPARSFRFNHQLHLGFGNLAPALATAVDSGRYLGPPGDMRRHLNSDNPCLACHRAIAETDLATEAHLPRMADCLVCHGKIDPPFSCGYCHTGNARLKPVSHTPDFADLHSNSRAVPKNSCKVCHGVKFTCMGCH